MVETMLDCFGLGHLFEVVVAYEECAESKANPEPLLFACENLGEFERGYYVVDMAKDAIAARRAGLVPVSLSRNGSFNTRVRLASTNTNLAQDLWEAVGYIGRSAEQDSRIKGRTRFTTVETCKAQAS